MAVVHAGGASFLEGGLIVMGTDDVREVAARVPVVVAVHMEAINHCHLSRADLRAAVPGVLVPEDGESLALLNLFARSGFRQRMPDRANTPQAGRSRGRAATHSPGSG